MIFKTMLDGARLHVRDTGRGRPVVFLHGWGASGAFFDKQCSLADRGLRLIIPDLRGHGLSQHPDRNLTIGLLASDLRTLVTDLELDRFALVGWSMGAMVAWEYLRVHGAAGVEKLTIVDMTARVVTDDGWAHGLGGAYPAERVPKTAQAIRHDWERFCAQSAAMLFACGRAPDPFSLQRLVALMRANHPDGMANLWIDMARRDYRGVLPTLGVDCQFIYGKESCLYNRDTILHVARLAGSERVVEVPEAGHAPHWEQPEAFAKALMAHLAPDLNA